MVERCQYILGNRNRWFFPLNVSQVLSKDRIFLGSSSSRRTGLLTFFIAILIGKCLISSKNYLRTLCFSNVFFNFFLAATRLFFKFSWSCWTLANFILSANSSHFKFWEKGYSFHFWQIKFYCMKLLNFGNELFPFWALNSLKTEQTSLFSKFATDFSSKWWCFVWLFPKDTDCANQDQSHLRCYYDYSWNTFHCHNVIKYKLLQNYTFYKKPST